MGKQKEGETVAEKHQEEAEMAEKQKGKERVVGETARPQRPKSKKRSLTGWTPPR